LTAVEAYEQNNSWFARLTLNPIVVQDLGFGSGARTPEGANYRPIIGKLTQAVQMFTIWARRGTSTVAQQMLRRLEIAREQAQAIYEDQLRGTPENVLRPRLQTLANLLREIQALDPGYELISIGEMSLTILNARRQMPRAPLPPWTMLDPALRPEYVRQLRDQENGLNSMLADQWVVARASFLATGRTAAEARLRREFGRRMGHPSGTAAPHNPDQGLAGQIDPTGPPAVSRVNSHIGSQNPGKIPAMEAAINAISPPGRLVTQLNFELTVV
jgi:hypothetical protein